MGTLLPYFDDLFGDIFYTKQPIYRSRRNSFPDWNHYTYTFKEGEEFYTLSIPLPGLSSSDIALNVDGDVLSIEASKGDSDAKKSYYKKQLQLPEDASGLESTAQLEKGVLTISIPKKPRAKKVIDIEEAI